jgi:hypothetical protein
MRKIIFACALAACLGGCAQWNAGLADLKAGWSKLTGATLSPTAVRLAVDAFDGVEATATNYISLPKCTGAAGGPALCHTDAAKAAIIKAITSGRVARNNLEQFLAGHQTALGSQGAYDAIGAATQTVKTIVGQYQ